MDAFGEDIAIVCCRNKQRQQIFKTFSRLFEQGHFLGSESTLKKSFVANIDKHLLWVTIALGVDAFVWLDPV